MNKKIPSLLMKAAGVLEVSVAALIIAVIFVGGWRLLSSTLELLLGASQTLDVNRFLSEALELIVGLEFVKMLLKHTPGAVVEVLLFAIARGMIVTHTDAFDTLLGVIAVAIIFAIRRYLSQTEKVGSLREETIDTPTP